MAQVTDEKQDKRGHRFRTSLLLVWGFLRRNIIGFLALGISVVSLWITLIDRRETHKEKLLAATMMAETIESSPASVEYTIQKYQYAPFRGPYLLLPVRILAMNDTSLPQTIIGIWISFDDEGPEDRIKYVALEDVSQTSGDKLAWPKTMAPWETLGFNVLVPVPIDEQIGLQLGVDSKKHHHVDLGPAGQLRMRLAPDVVDRMSRTVRFNIRLFSPSPGHPNQLTFKTKLPQ